MHSRKPSRLAVAVAAYTLALSLPAASETTSGNFELNPLVVTPSRFAETADKTLSAVSVIERDDIDRRQPQSTLELLRTETGIDITSNGGRAGNKSLFMRGTESNHTLVLVDGVRASSGTTGQFAWREMAPSQIERVEIVRGPRASVYGSDAIGGVIQMFTREQDGPRARVVAGSDRTRRVEAGFGGGDTVKYGLNAAWEATDGFPSQEEGAGVQEDHGYRSRSASGYFSAPLAANLELSGRGWLNKGDVEFSTDTASFPEPADYRTAFQATRNAASHLSLDHEINPLWHQQVSVGFSEDRIEARGASNQDQDDLIRTRRTEVSWRNELEIGPAQQVQFGADFREEDVLSEDRVVDETNFDETLGNLGVYGLWRGGYDYADLEASLRHDDNRDFGNETTWQAAAGFPVSPQVDWRVSGGTAFKAPSANELYSPGFGGLFAGNEELDAETAWSVETGLRYRSRDLSERVAFNLFYTRIDDLIAYEGNNSQAINIDEADIQGAEIEYNRVLDSWRFTANATLQRAENRLTGERLARRPDEKLGVVVGYDFTPETHVVVEGIASSASEERFGQGNAGYGLINLAMVRQLDSDLNLEFRVENLTDKDYQVAETYNTQGLAGFVGLSWEPGR